MITGLLLFGGFISFAAGLIGLYVLMFYWAGAFDD